MHYLCVRRCRRRDVERYTREKRKYSTALLNSRRTRKYVLRSSDALRPAATTDFRLLLLLLLHPIRNRNVIRFPQTKTDFPTRTLSNNLILACWRSKHRTRKKTITVQFIDNNYRRGRGKISSFFFFLFSPRRSRATV